MIKCGGFGDVAPALADDGDEFAFVIELVGDLRPHDGRALADEGGGEAGEQGGIVGLLETRLRRMVAIVEADADDLRRRREGRQDLDFGQVDRWALGEPLAGLGQRRATLSRQGRERSGESLVALVQAVRRAVRLNRQTHAVGVLKTDESHFDVSLRVVARRTGRKIKLWSGISVESNKKYFSCYIGNS